MVTGAENCSRRQHPELLAGEVKIYGKLRKFEVSLYEDGLDFHRIGVKLTDALPS